MKCSWNVVEVVLKCWGAGRSDFPNQVNNVCAFPYIFRGALDSRAVRVNEEMKQAATIAIARLAKQKYRKAKNFSYRQILEVNWVFGGGAALGVRG